MGMLRSLEEFGHLLALPQLYVRFLPVRAAPGESPLSLHLTVRDIRPHAFDFRAEQSFDSAPDLGLVCAGGDLKDDRPAVLSLDRRLLGNERPTNHIGEFHASASCNRSRAVLVATTRVASATSRAVSRPL